MPQPQMNPPLAQLEYRISKSSGELVLHAKPEDEIEFVRVIDISACSWDECNTPDQITFVISGTIKVKRDTHKAKSPAEMNRKGK